MIESMPQDATGTVGSGQCAEDDDRASRSGWRGDRSSCREMDPHGRCAEHGNGREHCRTCSSDQHPASHGKSIFTYAHYADRMGTSRAEGILDAFAREPGRSVHAIVQSPRDTWTGGVHDDEARPAASLLKLPLAMAVEPLLPNLPPARVTDLLAAGERDSVLCSLDPDRTLSPAEILRLMLSASDNACARWALEMTGIGAVVAACARAGAVQTVVTQDDHHALGGSTTAQEAIRLLRTAADPSIFPVAAFALRHSVRNSRIPLGATSEDVAIAHKTGTLAGVASDVAVIDCAGGSLAIAFLTERQHDTLVTGYEMGICTRSLLEAFDLRARATVSAMAGA